MSDQLCIDTLGITRVRLCAPSATVTVIFPPAEEGGADRTLSPLPLSPAPPPSPGQDTNPLSDDEPDACEEDLRKTFEKEYHKLPANAHPIIRRFCGPTRTQQIGGTSFDMPQRPMTYEPHALLHAELSKLPAVERARIRFHAEERIDRARTIGEHLRQCNKCLCWFFTLNRDDPTQYEISNAMHSGYVDEIHAAHSVLSGCNLNQFNAANRDVKSASCHSTYHGRLRISCFCRCPLGSTSLCECCMPFGYGKNTGCADACQECKGFMCHTCEESDCTTEGDTETAVGCYRRWIEAEKLNSPSHVTGLGRIFGHSIAQYHVAELHMKRMQRRFYASVDALRLRIRERKHNDALAALQEKEAADREKEPVRVSKRLRSIEPGEE